MNILETILHINNEMSLPSYIWSSTPLFFSPTGQREEPNQLIVVPYLLPIRMSYTEQMNITCFLFGAPTNKRKPISSGAWHMLPHSSKQQKGVSVHKGLVTGVISMTLFQGSSLISLVLLCCI